MNSNIYKYFRSTDDVVTRGRLNLNKRFDEPTYLSFRLSFAENTDEVYNTATNRAFFDTMPHPLFNTKLDVDVVLSGYGGLDKGVFTEVSGQPTKYSSLYYLRNANEPVRVELLKEFIQKFNDLQENYQYYFQSIEGIPELLRIDPTKGQRITNDKKLTITCLEALDLRMSYLLNLYRKIVWDDVYQRWVLPDMMRYFTLKIYLSEFRTFHLPQTTNKKVDAYGQYPNPGVTTGQISQSIVSSATSLLRGNSPVQPSLAGAPTQNNNSTLPLYLSVLDDILPVWVIQCEMCEFDITDINFEHLSGLTVNGDPVQGAVKFGIKVGNIKELQMYPVFKHMFLNDKKLNAINRTKETEIRQNYSPADPDSMNMDRITYPASLKTSQNNTFSVPTHETGKPYNERANTNTTSDANYAYSDKIPDKPEAEQTSSWIGNALTTGTAFAKAFANRYIDKAKMTSIPGLGFSFTDVTTALETKDIVGALGVVRKSISVVTNEHIMPSERLNGEIVDGTFRQFLVGISKSEATDPTSVMLKEAAGVALSDRGVWEKIRDYSMATDLTVRGEVNIKKDVQGGALIGGSPKNDLLSADLPQVIPGAVIGKINQESNFANEKTSSRLTGEVGEPIDRGIAASTLIDGTIQNELTRNIKPSSNLEGEVNSALDRGILPSSNLTGDVGEEINRGVMPSSNLEGEVTGALDRGIPPSSNLTSEVNKGGLNNDVIPSSNLTDEINESGLNTTYASSNLGENIITGGLNRDAVPSENLKDNVNGGMTQSNKSGLSTYIQEDKTLSNTKPSNKLSSLETTGTLNEPTIKKTLEHTVLKQEAPSMRTKTIDAKQIIEATPSSILTKQVLDALEQPAPSRATNNKLQDGSPDTTDEKSKATNQELFSP